MERWFTADLHLGGERCIDLQPRRPYSGLEEMEEDLVCRWNEVVHPHDIVYCLGDFAIGSAGCKERIATLFKRLNGDKQLVSGNHDNRNPFVKKLGWTWVGDVKNVKINGQIIVLFHYPMQAWDGSMDASWHLHGHTHGRLPSHHTWLRQDVGVDVHGYRPVSFEEIKEIMSRRHFVPPDQRAVLYEEDITQELWDSVKAVTE